MNNIIDKCSDTKEFPTKDGSVGCFQREINKLSKAFEHINLYNIFSACEDNPVGQGLESLFDSLFISPPSYVFHPAMQHSI
jgi:hypothetical protein